MSAFSRKAIHGSPPIGRASFGELTQGSIFAGGISEGYQNQDCFGIVITARCDIEHAKTPSITYLPIVRFLDWVNCDLTDLVATEFANALHKQLEIQLRQLGISPLLLNTHNVEELLESVPDSPKAKKASETVLELRDRLTLASKVKGGVAIDEEIARFRELARKSFQTRIKDCVSHKMLEYYYIPKIDPESQLEGFVIFLRQPRHMPRRAAELIAHGVEGSDLVEYDKYLNPAVDFLHVHGVLQSPWIEHLLQRFASLYTRIGVDDCTSEQLLSLERIAGLGPDSSEGGSRATN